MTFIVDCQACRAWCASRRVRFEPWEFPGSAEATAFAARHRGINAHTVSITEQED